MPLREEILEQTTIISNLVNSRADQVNQIAAKLGKPKRIFIAARGTSDNAARYAKYVWGVNNQVPVALAAPSLFSIYQKPPLLEDTLVVGISQSGESPDILAVIEEANRQRCPTLTITNQPKSPLAQLSDFVLDIHAGEEISVAATKSYTCQLVSIAMLSAAWEGSSKLWKGINLIPDQIEQVLALENQIQIFSKRYLDMKQCVVLGRGFNYSTAFEWSLKLKELTHVVAQPYSSADFFHGPIALVSSGFPVFGIAPQGAVFDDMFGLIKKIKLEQKADLFLISDQTELLSQADCPVPLPEGIPEWLTPISGIIPGQLFSYHLSLTKGMNPDSPRGLTKVTRTR
jgi:glucosamine--fructose-6-phosphate aminotransferase (isomerizing)